jgi:phage FluMu protein Com
MKMGQAEPDQDSIVVATLDARDLRCHCGSLVARVVGGELEIKCRRCHRIGLVRVPPDGTPVELEVRWQAGTGKARGK